MSTTRLGLEFDISDFRKGVTSAARLVSTNFSDKTFKPANKAIDSTAKNIRNRIGSALKSVQQDAANVNKGFSAFKGALGAIGVFWAIDKLGQGLQTVGKYLNESVELAVKARIEFNKLDRILRTMGSASTAKDFGALATTLRDALNVPKTDTFANIGNFLNQGYTESQAKELAIIAANISRQLGITATDAASKLGEALRGNVQAAGELGIKFASTGNAMKDQLEIAALLKQEFGNINAVPLDSVNQSIENLLASIGEKLLPYAQQVLTYINNIITAWQNNHIDSDLERWITQVITFAKGLRKAGADVIVFLQAVYAYVDLLRTIIQNNLSMAWEAVAHFIPALVYKAVELFVDTLKQALVSGAPGDFGNQLAKSLGLDAIKEHAGAIAKEKWEIVQSNNDNRNDELITKGKELWGRGNLAWDLIQGKELPRGLLGRLENGFDTMAKVGEDINKAALWRLNNEAPKGIRQAVSAMDLINPTYKSELAQQENQKLQQLKDAANTKQAERREKQYNRFATNNDVGAGQRIGITIVSRKNDQFRKVATR